MIYLDNAATTQPSPEIIEEIMPYMNEDYGNPGSVHHMGSEAKRAIDEARRNVAAYMGSEERGGNHFHKRRLRGKQFSGVSLFAV